MRGKFIVFEGGDGAGKDTQIELFQKIVPPEDYLFVRDPGSTEIGLQLRKIVRHDDRVKPSAELLIHLAARVQLALELIKPALDAGTNVVCNRFDLSTMAYQVYGRERKELAHFVKEMSDFALGGMMPDVVILLDIEPALGLTRAAQAGDLDRFEREKLAFHERVREGYLTHIVDYPAHHIIDASKSAEEVHREVKKALGL